MPRKGSLPTIAAHSLAKHRILGAYIQRYIEVLTEMRGIEFFRPTLVDGFAGGGEYDGGSGLICPGSPLILLDAVRAAEVAVNASRTKAVRVDAQHIFVEKDPATARDLLEVLRKRGDAPKGDGVVQLIEGAFEGQVDTIISRIKARSARGRAHRAIFVLDQYGYTGVPLPTLKRIFAELPNAEVFLTLAVGWITAYLPNSRTAAERLGLSPEEIARLCSIDEDGLDVADAERRPTLLAIQRILHHAFTAEVGARFYTPFFIVSRESNRPYWFLHIANSPRAHDVVKTLHWKVENHFEHFGAPGLLMLGYDPNADPAIVRQQTFRFDNQAKVRTHTSLLAELPARISAEHPSGIRFGELFNRLCNETPATRDQLAASVRELCIEGELEKVGAEGERRAPTTLPHDDDVVAVATQSTLRFPK
jgi:three-Cys-motif partner protein